MLSIDSRSQYGKLQLGDFSMQDEIQVLKIIYAAACDMTNSNMWQLRNRLQAPGPDTVRVLQYIHTSDMDARPHITLLFTQQPQTIVHVVARFDPQRQRWQYVQLDAPSRTDAPRNLVSPKHITWTSLETYGNLG